MSAPERIWVNLDSNEDGCCPVEDDLSDTGKFFDRNSSVEYTRTDTIPNAAYVAGLEAALIRILPQNLGPLPEPMPDSETVPVDMTFGEIRQARAALASRPASPDVRVVTDEMVEKATMILLGHGVDPAPGVDWTCNRDWSANTVRTKMRQALRAIIGGQP